jgi:adenosylcobyric acid synthase
MHIGRTDGPDCARPLLRFADGRVDGAVSRDGRVMGAYVHGMFGGDWQRAAWLARLGAHSELAYESEVERTLDDLAAHLAAHVDLDALLKLAR